jgi:glycosyltransferase involved in cell wall biosynthesis
MSTKKIVMVGTRHDTMGGISSVVNVYRACGLFEQFPIVYLDSHCDGSIARKIWIAMRALARFLALLVTGQVGLLHVHMSRRASCWRKMTFVWPAYLFKVPVIVHIHSSGFPEFYENCGPLRRALIRATLSRAKRIAVLSAHWQDWFARLFAASTLVVIPNPVEVPPGCVEWSAREPRSVLFLGRLGYHKGTYDLLRAAKTVIEQGQPLTLWLAGDGEAEQVKTYASDLGLNANVHVLGWVRGAQKRDLLRRATVYALPSHNEGLPMSLLEAMASGLPSISTGVGGIPSALTDGVEGYLIAPGDDRALAARLASLMSDQVLAQRMGQAARRRIESQFAPDVVMPGLRRLYAEFGFHS